MKSIAFPEEDKYPVAIVAATAAFCGWHLVYSIGVLFFYQTYGAEIVSAACGFEPVAFAAPPRALDDFLMLKSPSFDCSLLSGLVPTQDSVPGVIQRNYLLIGVELLWKMFGVSYLSLWPLVAALHAAFSVACYALIRCFYRPPVATLGGLLMAVSPVTVSYLFHLRDYSKAPFIIAGVVLCIAVVRTSKSASLLLLAFVLGAVTGVGVGFRPDVFIVAPLALIAIALAGKNLLPPYVRGMAIVVYLVSVWFFLLPLPNQGGSGGYALIILQGMSSPFTANLAIDAPSYDLGWAYSDELSLGTIASDLRKNPPPFGVAHHVPGVADAMSNANAHALSWMPLFAGDLAARALKSFYLSASYFPLIEEDRRAYDPNPGVNLPMATTVPETFYPVWSALALVMVLPVGIFGFAALIARSFARQPREALFLAVGIPLLLGASGAQFSLRHMFHLEVFSWLFLFSLIALPFDRIALRSFSRLLPWATGYIAIAVATYLALNVAQDRLIRGAMTAMLEQPRQIIPLAPEAGVDGYSMFPVPVPAEFRLIVDGPPDSHAADNKWTGRLDRLETAAIRLLVTIDPAGCATDTFELKTLYTKEPDTWQPFGRTFVEPLLPGEVITLITPAFYRSTQHFVGLAVPTASVGCVQAIETIQPEGKLPSSFSAIFSRNGNALPLHHGLGKLW